MTHYWYDILAGSSFFVSWLGYTLYAAQRGKKTYSLFSMMHLYRIDWIKGMLQRDNRIADISAIGNLERNSAFFASACIFIVAGLMTVVTSSEDVMGVLNGISFIETNNSQLWDVKIGLTIVVYIYAFFTFTWSMRQFGFVLIMMGSAPSSKTPFEEIKERHFIEHTAKVMDLAARQFNLGLRAFYFSLALVFWLIGPVYFMVSNLVIIGVLYRREFHSKTLTALIRARGLKRSQPF